MTDEPVEPESLEEAFMGRSGVEDILKSLNNYIYDELEDYVVEAVEELYVFKKRMRTHTISKGM